MYLFQLGFRVGYLNDYDDDRYLFRHSNNIIFLRVLF